MPGRTQCVRCPACGRPACEINAQFFEIRTKCKACGRWFHAIGVECRDAEAVGEAIPA